MDDQVRDPDEFKDERKGYEEEPMGGQWIHRTYKRAVQKISC